MKFRVCLLVIRGLFFRISGNTYPIHYTYQFRNLPLDGCHRSAKDQITGYLMLVQRKLAPAQT